MAPHRRHTPVYPAKQADRAMESTVTTVRGSLGMASLGPGPVATADGKGGEQRRQERRRVGYGRDWWPHDGDTRRRGIGNHLLGE